MRLITCVFDCIRKPCETSAQNRRAAIISAEQSLVLRHRFLRVVCVAHAQYVSLREHCLSSLHWWFSWLSYGSRNFRRWFHAGCIISCHVSWPRGVSRLCALSPVVCAMCRLPSAHPPTLLVVMVLDFYFIPSSSAMTNLPATFHHQSPTLCSVHLELEWGASQTTPSPIMTTRTSNALQVTVSVAQA